MGADKLVCVTLLLLVNLQFILCKPLFGGRMWCDLFCDDDDDSASSSIEDLLDVLFDPCTDCPRRPSSTMMPFNIMIPPNPTGMNLTLTPNGALWNMGVMPWNQMGQGQWGTAPPGAPPGVPPGVAPGAPPAATPGVPPSTPPAPAVTPPPPSVLPITTAAPAAGTTAAGSSAAPGSTTAAATTAAPAG